VAAGTVAQAPPDGYTLLITSSAHAVQPALYPTLPYDPLKAFVDIAPLARQPYVLVVGPSAGVHSVSALIAAAKAKPGQLTFSAAGTGSGAHFTAEKFKMAAGIDVVYVPSQDVSEANAATTAGRVTYWFPALAAALPAIRDGKLLPLGVSSAQRSGVLPEVPTMAESGVTGYDDTIWVGLWAPAGTPASIVDKLTQDVARVLAAPDVRERLATLGAEPMRLTAAEFARFVRSETEAAARIMQAAGIKPQ
jgi:tripartite-type tricarboxylate transporter receptor subunit TctC